MGQLLLNKYRWLYVIVITAMAIALAAYIGIGRASAFAVFNVSNTNDIGVGSLRQAITDANAAGGGTINFTAGVSGIINLQTTLPDLSSNITINGPGAATLTVQRSFAAGTPFFRVFTTNGSGISISGLTIKNGSAGIYNYGTLLSVTNCTVTGNIASDPNGGGGINNKGSMTLTNSTVSNNMSGIGGILSEGSMTIINSRIVNNSSGVCCGFVSSGGGIAITFESGTMTIINSTIANNIGGTGCGGICNLGTLTITGSTITSNSTIAEGAPGGGISNSGILNLINSTVTNNSTHGAGAGIINLNPVPNFGGNATLNLTSSTVANNSGGSGSGITNIAGSVVNLQNSIIAKNTGIHPDFNGILVSQGNNLIGDTTGSSGSDNSKGDLLNIDPLFELGVDSKPLLKNNGGPTQTIALLATSPAIDRGKNLSGLTTDQRGTGFIRTYDNPLISNVQGDGTDIGALELQPSFDFCLQDDSTNAILQINSQTGDYRLCCGGQTYSGKGQINRRGSVLTLESNTGNRRIQAKLDQATRRASASLQSTGGSILCTIADRDFTNNNCVCSQ